MMEPRSRRIVEVTDYWPEVSEDLSLVTWSHATNSQAEVKIFHQRKYFNLLKIFDCSWPQP